MKIDGYLFNEKDVFNAGKEKFLEHGMGAYFLDLSDTDRRTKLSDFFDRINEKFGEKEKKKKGQQEPAEM